MPDLPDFKSLLRGAQKIQEQLQKTQAELSKKSVHGEAGAGLVKARVNGKQQLLGLELDPQLFKTILAQDDQRMLADLVVAAVNQALERAAELSKRELSQLAAAGNGMNFPGFDLSSVLAKIPGATSDSDSDSDSDGA